jgi:DNA-binding MarR family transcriptional regulator
MSKAPTAAQSDELRRLMQRMFRRFDALATDQTPCGKPLSIAHAHALMVLLAKGEASQRDLGAELSIDKSNVARLCARMVESGHVIQRANEDDGRSRRVSLTARGRRIAREVETASGARFSALLAGVPADQRTQVVEALQHLVAALDALPASPVTSNEGDPE